MRRDPTIAGRWLERLRTNALFHQHDEKTGSRFIAIRWYNIVGRRARGGWSAGGSGKPAAGAAVVGFDFCNWARSRSRSAMQP